MSDWPFLLDFARHHRGARMALATLVACEGSSYRPAGARMLVLEDGQFCGLLSGGCLEERIASVATRVIRTSQSEMLEIDTRPHFGCPGVLRIFIERTEDALIDRIADRLRERSTFQITTNHPPSLETGTRLESTGPAPGVLTETVKPTPRLLAIGWTRDMDPILKMADMIGWERHRILRDLRMLDETPPVSSEHIEVLSADELVDRYPPDDRTAVLIMTHHLATDLGYLKAVFPHAYGYIGLLGSRRRRETLLAELGECGLLEDETLIESFHAPVGLDLGGDHPTVIGLAIVAEIQAVLAGHRGGFLRERGGAIHLAATA